jgi:hypothetical protein
MLHEQSHDHIGGAQSLQQHVLSYAASGCRLQCAELLKQAKSKYGAKDLMGALKLFEDVLAQVMVHSAPHALCLLI